MTSYKKSKAKKNQKGQAAKVQQDENQLKALKRKINMKLVTAAFKEAKPAHCLRPMTPSEENSGDEEASHKEADDDPLQRIVSHQSQVFSNTSLSAAGKQPPSVNVDEVSSDDSANSLNEKSDENDEEGDKSQEDD